MFAFITRCAALLRAAFGPGTGRRRHGGGRHRSGGSDVATAPAPRPDPRPRRRRRALYVRAFAPPALPEHVPGPGPHEGRIAGDDCALVRPYVLAHEAERDGAVA
ncbi:hypothetical protein [Streptomyces sp. HNM0574]|uniref:hypothetical protein n=1 Tax=Streptomyces sp. HNM0574 TaxID=2714954 RepID=UPI00146E5D4B|nr:hypothetical protein [Streptomyces sp. HNM0574]NLU66775.1 hypothetical protein [Streptomyces sp. HNM0574]